MPILWGCTEATRAMENDCMRIAPGAVRQWHRLEERSFVLATVAALLAGQADYVFLAAFLPFQRRIDTHMLVDFLFLGEPLPEFQRHIHEAFADPAFGILDYAPPFYLWKRGYPRTLNAEAERAALADLERMSSGR